MMTHRAISSPVGFGALWRPLLALMLSTACGGSDGDVSGEPGDSTTPGSEETTDFPGAAGASGDPNINGGSDPAAGTGDAPQIPSEPTPSPSPCEPGTTGADEVVLIGDSYLDQAPDWNIQFHLENIARAAGSLAPGESYRRYYMAGTAFDAIVQQWHTANAQGPHRVVIMTGGGNDVLIFNRQCLEPGSSTNAYCQGVVQGTLDMAAGLMDTAASSGVEDVIYFFYPNLPGSLLAPASSNEILDYTYPLAREMCEGATALRCHFIDTRPAFAGRPELIQIDGIHPTAEGSLVIAELIWNVMQQHCIAL